VGPLGRIGNFHVGRPFLVPAVGTFETGLLRIVIPADFLLLHLLLLTALLTLLALFRLVLPGSGPGPL